MTPRFWIDAQQLPTAVAVLLLLAMLGAGGLAYDGFLSGQVMLNLLIDNGFLLIVAVGLFFVIVAGGIDLSVGSVVALTTMGLAWGVERAHWPLEVLIPLLLVAGTLFGAAMGAVVQYAGIPSFIVTLAGMFLARGLCYLISIDSIAIQDPTLTEWSQARVPVPGLGELSYGAIVALLTLVAAIWLADATPFGRTVYAVGGQERSALLMGLPVARTRVAVHALCSFCATLGGIVFGIYTLSGYGLHAQGLELDAIAAVVIGGALLSGGVGHVAGTLTGVLMLGAVQTLIIFDGTLSSWWTRIVIGGLLGVFCVLQRAVAWGHERRAGRASMTAPAAGPSPPARERPGLSSMTRGG